MVDATLTPTAPDVRVGEKPLRFCLHYLRTDDAVRYCVRLEEVGLDVPPNVDLETLAANQNWGRMKTGIPAAGMSSEKQYAPVHLGTWYQSRRSKRGKRWREQMDAATFLAEEVFGESEGVEWDVSPQSVLLLGNEERAILEGGEFRVSGQVLFRPLQPFDPDPKIPDPEDRFVTIEEVQYSYP